MGLSLLFAFSASGYAATADYNHVPYVMYVKVVVVGRDCFLFSRWFPAALHKQCAQKLAIIRTTSLSFFKTLIKICNEGSEKYIIVSRHFA